MARRRIAGDRTRHRLTCEECVSAQPCARSSKHQPFMKSVLIVIYDQYNRNKSLERSEQPGQTAVSSEATTKEIEMLTVGERIPGFDLQAVVSTDMEQAFARITD